MGKNMKQKKEDTMGLPEGMMPDRGHRTGLGPKVYAPSGRGGRGFSKRTIAYGVLGLVLLAILVYVPTYIKNHKKQAPSETQKITVQVNRLPEGLPADLPYLGAEKVIHNFSVETADQGTGAVRQWQVNKPVAEIAEGYRTYFKAFGWEIVTDASQVGISVLGAGKNGEFMTVSIKPAAGDAAASTVEVGVRRIPDQTVATE